MTAPPAQYSGVKFGSPVQVKILDASGRVVPDFVGDVTIGLGGSRGGGVLVGTRTVGAVAGVATFADLEIDGASATYSLFVTSPGLVPRTSAAFRTHATRLVFRVQPRQVTVGTAFAPAITVAAEDFAGHALPQFTGSVHLYADGDQHPYDPYDPYIATGTTTVVATAGAAAFTNIKIRFEGIGWTLIASAPGVSPDTSVSFDALTSHLVAAPPSISSSARALLTPESPR
ncbi:MAG: hypothetical protein ABI742_10110, partial [Gemmatimonadota bacterium]